MACIWSRTVWICGSVGMACGSPGRPPGTGAVRALCTTWPPRDRAGTLAAPCATIRVICLALGEQQRTGDPVSAEVTMTIDGVASSTEATFDVINPATGAPEATAPDCTPQPLDAAMAPPAKASRDWRRDESRRRDRLPQFAAAPMGATEGHA